MPKTSKSPIEMNKDPKLDGNSPWLLNVEKKISFFCLSNWQILKRKCLVPAMVGVQRNS